MDWKSSRQERRERNEARLREEDEERARLAAEKEEKYRYMSASDRAFNELEETVGTEQADKVKSLIEAMIQDAKPPYEGP